MLDGKGHIGLGCNVAEEASVRAAFESAEQRLGPVSVLVCFAGILSTQPAPGRLPTVDITLEEWEGVMRVNARGTFLCVREMLRRCADRTLTDGRIVTVASLAGQVGGMQSGSAYSASKGGMNLLTRVMWGPFNIQTNAVAPTVVHTDMGKKVWGDEEKSAPVKARIPMHRFGTPLEIADLVLFLASPASDFICGQVVMIDGGYSAV